MQYAYIFLTFLCVSPVPMKKFSSRHSIVNTQCACGCDELAVATVTCRDPNCDLQLAASHKGNWIYCQMHAAIKSSSSQRAGAKKRKTDTEVLTETSSEPRLTAQAVTGTGSYSCTHEAHFYLCKLLIYSDFSLALLLFAFYLKRTSHGLQEDVPSNFNNVLVDAKNRRTR
jgi:hypothetical protein